MTRCRTGRSVTQSGLRIGTWFHLDDGSTCDHPFSEAPVNKPPKMHLIPGPARVLVRPLKGDELTDSGIWIPEGARGDGTLGIVEAGCVPYDQDGEEYKPLYPVGAYVLMSKHSGTTVQLGREEFRIIRENDILARAVYEGEQLEKPKVHE